MTLNPIPNSRGFTLIEVMIVVAIISILATLSYGSYQESQRKAKRAEAKTTLIDLAQRMERCYTANGSYNNANCSVHDGADLDPAFTSTENGHYSVAFANLTATTYTLTAAVSNFVDPQCNNLTLNQAGTKTATDDGGGDTSAVCW